MERIASVNAGSLLSATRLTFASAFIDKIDYMDDAALADLLDRSGDMVDSDILQKAVRLELVLRGVLTDVPVDQLPRPVTPETIGERINILEEPPMRLWRQLKGFSLREVARATGIEIERLRSLDSAIDLPTPDELDSISAAIGVERYKLVAIDESETGNLWTVQSGSEMPKSTSSYTDDCEDVLPKVIEAPPHGTVEELEGIWMHAADDPGPNWLGSSIDGPLKLQTAVKAELKRRRVDSFVRQSTDTVDERRQATIEGQRIWASHYGVLADA